MGLFSRQERARKVVLFPNYRGTGLSVLPITIPISISWNITVHIMVLISLVLIIVLYSLIQVPLAGC